MSRNVVKLPVPALATVVNKQGRALCHQSFRSVTDAWKFAAAHVSRSKQRPGNIGAVIRPAKGKQLVVTWDTNKQKPVSKVVVG